MRDLGLKRIANSPVHLFAVFVLTMLFAAIAYGRFEDAAFLDSVYWAVVTATTLGYGDFSPHSGGGKALTVILISFTVFVLIPTITANMAAWLIVNRDAFTHDEQEEIKVTLRDIYTLLESSQGGLHE